MKTQAQTQSEPLVQAIHDYLLVCRVSKSAKSVQRAEYALHTLMQWCHQRGITALHQLTRSELLTWCLALQQQPLSAQTVWTLTSTVRAFLNWCVTEDYLAHPPLKPGDFPSKPKPQPKPLSVAEVDRLLALADGKHWLQKRNHAMLTVLLHCGCRRSELLQMTAGDVERGFSLVVQKGGRPHTLHLNNECVQAIQSYLRALRRQKHVSLKPEDALWRANDGSPLTENAVRLLFARLSRQFGQRVWCHRMRATSATLHLANKQSTEAVRLMLGHSDSRSIQSYVQLAQADLARLLDETSPLKLLSKR